MSANGIYCTYLTIYLGNKMPMFYIGHTSISKISNGYTGSVGSKEYSKIWAYENKHNKHLFKTKILKTFNTRAEAVEAELKLQKAFKCASNPMYINKAYASTNFLPENPTPWNKGLTAKTDKRVEEYGKKCKETLSNNPKEWIRSAEYINSLKERMTRDNPSNRKEVKAKLSAASSGENNPMYGVKGVDHPRYGKHHTEEAREKIRKKSIGRKASPEAIANMKANAIGRMWFYNPKTNESKFVVECPDGYIPGRPKRKSNSAA